MMLCANCKGSGEVPNTAPDCYIGGMETVIDYPDFIDCPECNGTGEGAFCPVTDTGCPEKPICPWPCKKLPINADSPQATYWKDSSVEGDYWLRGIKNDAAPQAGAEVKPGSIPLVGSAVAAPYLVSSEVCSDTEIAVARSCGRFFTIGSFGYVVRVGPIIAPDERRQMDPKLLEEIRAELTRWGMGGVVKPVVLSDLLNRVDKEIGGDWKSMAIDKEQWESVEWKRVGRGFEDDLSIRLMRSPFYDGTKYAVRQHGRCLNKSSEWEYEPMPSSREDDFYARCRFDSFADALAALDKAKAS